ncbi:hypothetical protein vseg_010714 [Gypsophila vaccaria]
MENVVLKMHYMSRFVNVKVDDTDQSQLIDVINDLYDEADSQGFSLPNHPSLSYTYEGKSIYLRDDKGLLEMYRRCNGNKVIDIRIGSDTTPCNVLLMARQVRVDNNDSGLGKIEPNSAGHINVNPIYYNCSSDRKKTAY